LYEAALDEYLASLDAAAVLPPSVKYREEIGMTIVQGDDQPA
jgi:hypothetical protein